MSKEEKSIERTADLFKLLSDPTRIKILLTLQYGEKCVHEISEETETGISNVSHHLRRMRDRDLIDCEKKGRHKYYRIKNDFIISIIEKGIKYGE